MNKTLVAILTVIGISLMAVSAYADVTYSPLLYDAKDHNGNIINEGTYVMLLDTNNNGWDAGLSYASPANALNAPSGNWLWDPSDYVMSRGAITFGLEQDMSAAIYSNNVPAGYSTGDNIYALWYATPYSVSAQGPGEGIWYGAVQIGTAQDHTTGNTYTWEATAGNANLRTTVVPEPASMFLGLLGGVSLLVRRRFGRKVAA